MHGFDFDSGWDDGDDIKTVYGKKGFPYDQMRKAVQAMVKKDWPCKKLVFKGRDLARKNKWVNQAFLKMATVLKEPEKPVREQIQDLSRLWWHAQNGMSMEEFRGFLDKKFSGRGILDGDGLGSKATNNYEGVFFATREESDAAVHAGTHMWVNRVGLDWILLPLDFARTGATNPKEALELLKSEQFQPVAADRSVFMVPNQGRWSYETYMKALKDQGKLKDTEESIEPTKMKTEKEKDDMVPIGKVYVSPRVKSRPKSSTPQ